MEVTLKERDNQQVTRQCMARSMMMNAAGTASRRGGMGTKEEGTRGHLSFCCQAMPQSTGS